MPKSVLFLAPLLLVAAATPIQPGKWATTITIVDLAMPGAPPGVAAAMRGHPTTISSCVTPAQAAQGPRAVASSGGRCRYTNFTMAGGRIQSTMVCTQPGGTMTTRSSGSFTPTSITMESVGTSTGRTPMTMKSRVVSRRTGGC